MRVPGHRVGTKRRDMRWLAPDGTEWDSKFEYEVFLGFRDAGYRIRKCESPNDSLRFTRPVRNAVCLQCGAGRVVSTHSYTPDLSITAEDNRQHALMAAGADSYIECKGYLRAERRSLLRALCKEQPDLPLRFVVQRDYPINKKGTTVRQWISRFLKKPVAVWDNKDVRSLKWE